MINLTTIVDCNDAEMAEFFRRNIESYIKTLAYRKPYTKEVHHAKHQCIKYESYVDVNGDTQYKISKFSEENTSNKEFKLSSD